MVELPGITSQSPIGFLAALGMLRVLAEDRGMQVRLGWRGGCAVIDGITLEETIDQLAADMAGREKALEFTWADSTRKIPPETYRQACAKADGDHRALGFLAGWGSDAVFGIERTDTKFAPGKPGLIWLAFEAIPLHPVVPVSSRRASTTGWRSGPDSAYVWPVWEGLLGLDEVATLRTLPLERLEKRPGITEVWASRYGASGKYGMLLPARRER